MDSSFEEYVEKVCNKFELQLIIIINQLTSNIHEMYIYDAPFSTLKMELLLLVLS